MKKEMKKESILYGIIGLLTGVVITGFFAAYAVNNNHQGMMNMMGLGTSGQGMMQNDEMSMSDMTAALKNKTGDDFDKAFISQMVIHHQGAIDMAKLAKQNAKHDEIKKLADDILAAQAKEINMMQAWEAEWGYESSSGSNDMMRH